MKRVVLITGVGGGIGLATARLFSSCGWIVVGVDLFDNVQLSDGDLYIKADCSNPLQISESIIKVEQKYKRLDSLVHNAAIQINTPVLDLSLEDWDKTFNINLRAAFLLAKACHERLKRSQGNIVNVSSVHAVATSLNIAAYAASKGGLTAFTRALAIEWAHDNIRVNCVLPGAVDTPMLREGLGRGYINDMGAEDRLTKLCEKTVMGRVGKPDEIAKMIIFLADQKQSSFITGQSFIIDGGATIHLSTE